MICICDKEFQSTFFQDSFHSKNRFIILYCYCTTGIFSYQFILMLTVGCIMSFNLWVVAIFCFVFLNKLSTFQLCQFMKFQIPTWKRKKNDCQQAKCSPVSLFTVSGCLRSSRILLSNRQHLSMKNRTKHSWRAKVNTPSMIMVLLTVEGEDEREISCGFQA